LTSGDPNPPATDADPAAALTLASARRWSIAAMIAGGSSGLLLPVLGCLILVTMGIAMFLFPVLLPGFLIGFLCAVRARRLEASVGAYTPRTKGAYVLNAIGLSATSVLSLIAGCVAAIAYFGK
jgi:hypothetical protein